MFTGIIEETGILQEVVVNGSNKAFWIKSTVSSDLRPDQSVAHDGVCLTVEDLRPGVHRVTAIEETLKKTTLTNWKVGDRINIERCLQMNGRLDGHIVQGHVDTTGECIGLKSLNGSWEIEVLFPEDFAHLIIEKGSICFDGISLTAFNVSMTRFTVAVIPYTFDHTNISGLKIGDKINLEFDIIGKYLHRSTSLLKNKVETR